MGHKHLTTMGLLTISLIGLALILYPSFSNAWNERHATRAVASYSEQVAQIKDEDYADVWVTARAYNEKVRTTVAKHELSEELQEEYEKVLDVTGLGIMGYIEIPRINVILPVYHGTSDGVLQIAVGHVDWSSLPIGGVGTHSVLSGHRGLPSAKLFTDLPQLERGDTFFIRVLNELLTYEVDQILTVEPHQLDALNIDPNRDYCTLVTCTPYGINSHRLLVRGHRIANVEESRSVLVTSDAVRIEPMLVVPVVAAPILVLLVVYVLISSRYLEEQRRQIKPADILKEEV